MAEKFGKRHDNVLQAIGRLECSPEFTALNFQASDYTDSTGRKLAAYRMTRDGFVFLAMGFTGREGGVVDHRKLRALKTAPRARGKPETGGTQ